jgi:hypothetical protein
MPTRDRLVPVQVLPEAGVVVAGGVRRDQGLVDRVVGLRTTETFIGQIIDLPSVGLPPILLIWVTLLGLLDLVAEQRVVDVAVEPRVFGLDVFGQGEVAFARFVGDAALGVLLGRCACRWRRACRRWTSPRSSWWRCRRAHSSGCGKSGRRSCGVAVQARSFLCGPLPWQATQVAGLPLSALPRMWAPFLSCAVGV